MSMVESWRELPERATSNFTMRRLAARLGPSADHRRHAVAGVLIYLIPGIAQPLLRGFLQFAVDPKLNPPDREQVELRLGLARLDLVTDPNCHAQMPRARPV